MPPTSAKLPEHDKAHPARIDLSQEPRADLAFRETRRGIVRSFPQTRKSNFQWLPPRGDVPAARGGALAAKAATTTIPIVFETGADPVQLGLVASLNRPGGNITGVTQLGEEIVPKRLELLHELVPAAKIVALLVNPTDPALATSASRAALATAPVLGLELHVLNASGESDFDEVFVSLKELQAGGLVIAPDVLLPATSSGSPRSRSATRHLRSTSIASS